MDHKDDFETLCTNFNKIDTQKNMTTADNALFLQYFISKWVAKAIFVGFKDICTLYTEGHLER